MVNPAAVGLSSCREMAQEYLRLGLVLVPIHSVQDGRCSCGGPDCESPGKHPRIKWRDLSDLDPSMVSGWFRRWPDAGVGILTGRKSGIFVLDVDPRHGGEDSLAELDARHGPLPETVISITGGGGRHYLFCHPDFDIGNQVGIRPGLDLRGDGGLIVAPPSVHASGDCYRWREGFSPWDLEVADAPEWLLDLVQKPDRTNGGGNATPIPDVIPEGRRNADLASLAGSMRRRRASQETIESALLEENRRRCRPPLPEDQVRKIAESISRYPPAPSGPPAPTDADAPRIRPERLYRLTDLGNAGRFADRNRDDLRYCYPWGRWFVWDGIRWKLDDIGEVERRAKRIIQDIDQEVLREPDSEKRKALRSWSTKSEEERRIQAMIRLGRSEEGLQFLPDDLDRDPWLLNVLNGTLNLRTGKLRPHDRADQISKLVPVAYDPEATCPGWDCFLQTIMAEDADLVGFLRRVAGYCLTGSTQEQCLFFLNGPGANGKSSFENALLDILGDYGLQTSPDVLMMRRGNIPNDIAALKGVRFAAAIEVEEGRRMAEVMVKQLTGGDRVSARFMRAEWFTFSPQCKVVLAANHRPVIRGTDLAIWRRIRLIPFEVIIPVEKRIPNLKEVLVESEASGILAWMVRGCMEWQQDGLNAPRKVLAATEAYREESDVVGSFIEEKCIEERNAEVTVAALHAAYVKWCKENEEKALTKKALTQRLLERGFDPGKNTRGDRCWNGVGLRAEQTAIGQI